MDETGSFLIIDQHSETSDKNVRDLLVQYNSIVTVAIESPFAGDVEKNIKYTRACVKDCLSRNEAPFASHLLYTQEGILDDTKVQERNKGMLMGKIIEKRLDKTVVYTDLGISGGMKWGIQCAKSAGRPIEFRSLGKNWEDSL